MLLNMILTWRRSQDGLVGWERRVNSGPFSQLPAETKINYYTAIVLKEARQHHFTFAKSVLYIFVIAMA